MKPLTLEQQEELVHHLRYVTQKVRRYAESRADSNVKARLHAAADMACVVEDAEEFLKTLEPSRRFDRFWNRLLSWLEEREQKA